MLPVSAAVRACVGLLALLSPLAAMAAGMAPRQDAPVSIPLTRGLIVTTAVAAPGGDYESRKWIAAREDGGWLLRYGASLPGSGGRATQVSNTRFLHDTDLATARTYRNQFEDGVDEDYPGTTALGASTAVLAELKSKGAAAFALVGEPGWIARSRSADPAQAAIQDFAGGLLASANTPYRGRLTRRARGSLEVLVNGRMRPLPVVVADGVFTAKGGGAIRAELRLLDDPRNPIALQWRMGASALRVVRIDYPTRTRVALSEALRRDRRVALPGLYFDFGSAVLKPESAPALDAILAAVQAQREPSLRLEGHTDAIGAAKTNLALSRARAASVRAALVKRDASLALRLRAEGFGATRPAADNRTLQGRARNRRVELVLP